MYQNFSNMIFDKIFGSKWTGAIWHQAICCQNTVNFIMTLMAPKELSTKRVKRVKEIAVHTRYSMSQWTTTAWCQQCIDIYGKSLAVNILTHWALARDYEINIMSIDCCLVLITQGRKWNGALNYRRKRYKLFKVLPVSIIHKNRVVSQKIHNLWWQYIHGCQLTDLSEFDFKFQNPVMVPLINRRSDFKLEIVDQWSTRIPPPHRRGWQWAMGGLQLNIVQNHKAAITKWHSWQSLGFCLQPQRTCTWNLKLKFQSKLELRCRNHAIQKPKNLIWPLGSHL